MKGVKLVLVHGEVTYNLEIDKKRVYCSPAASIPVGWSKVTVNGKLLQKMKGHRLEWTLRLTNREVGDEAKIERLVLMINLSRQYGLGITLYPDWDSDAAENDSFTVLCVEPGGTEDKSKRVNAAQVMDGVTLQSKGLHKDES